MASQPETESRAIAVSPAQQQFALMQRKATIFASSPLIPEHLRKGTPEQALANCYIALTMAEAMGENPLIVMQNIHVVSGKAGFAAQYMIARANASGIFKGRINWRVDRSNAQNLSVTAFATLADTGEVVEFTVDMAMAKAEKWTNNAKYTTMPEVMLRYRSATFLIRFYAPDVMLGYSTREEVDDITLAAGRAVQEQSLTGAKLIEQAKTEDATEVTAEVVDPHTGEVKTGLERPDGQAGYDLNQPSATVRQLLADVAKAETVIDVKAIEDELPDYLDEAERESVMVAIEARRAELKGPGRG